MAFKDETLTFEDTKILNESNAEVMMDWEHSIMEKINMHQVLMN